MTTPCYTEHEVLCSAPLEGESARSGAHHGIVLVEHVVGDSALALGSGNAFGVAVRPHDAEVARHNRDALRIDWKEAGEPRQLGAATDLLPVASGRLQKMEVTPAA